MAKSARKKTKLEEAVDHVLEQRRWIANHGGDLAGYIAAYGDEKASPDLSVARGGRVGGGGQVVYAADCEILSWAEAEVARLTLLRIGQLSRRSK